MSRKPIIALDYQVENEQHDCILGYCDSALVIVAGAAHQAEVLVMTASADAIVGVVALSITPIQYA